MKYFVLHEFFCPSRQNIFVVGQTFDVQLKYVYFWQYIREQVVHIQSNSSVWLYYTIYYEKSAILASKVVPLSMKNARGLPRKKVFDYAAELNQAASWRTKPLGVPYVPRSCQQ